MKAVIMAGGEGTRLRPLTSLLPKPMVPVVNQPVMEHIIGLVRHHGMEEVIATLAFMPQVIEDYFGEGDEWGVRIKYAIEETPLGTAGSVKNAQKLLAGDEPFLIISGDAITDIDLTAVIAFHKSHGGAVTIALKRVDNPLDFGVVITGDDGKIERFLEKPTWGQVFSDQINTGIYVVEPWVLDRIPEGTSYDWSSEVFPKLMADGHDIYGVAVDGYWCDVGSRESYLDVHRDILEGKARIFVPGVQAKERLWVAESASVHPSATLGKGVVIGKNCKIGPGVVLGDYVVLGDNVWIGQDARLDHTVVWNDTFIGGNSTIAGSVICRRVDIRARTVIDAGVTVGDESVVSHGAHLGADVQVFPYKRIESAATVNTSVIWESTALRTLFTGAGIKGIVGIDITPELALKVAEAFGSLLPKGGHVVLTRDTSRPARMMKRAIAAGLNASGINVRDLRVASPALSRFTTQKTRCVGGIHVAVCADDPQRLEIRFFDKNGLDVGPWEQKKIERLYFRGEFRRAFFEDVGDILYPARPLEYYAAALDEAISAPELGEEWRKVVVDMSFGAGSLVLPQVAGDWKLNVIALNPIVDTEAGEAGGRQDDLANIRHAVELFAADLGVSLDKGAERIKLITPSGELLDGDVALHAMVKLWCMTRTAVEGGIAVPLTASLAVERIAAEYGREVVRPGRSRRALAQAVLDGRAVFAGSPQGGYIFGDFFPAYDGVLSVGMAARMIGATGRTLDELVADLPEFHKARIDLFCPVDRKGAVMREVTAAASGLKADLTEGVRVHYPDGWALVLPDTTEPSVSVWAEAADEESADARSHEWQAVVERAIEA